MLAEALKTHSTTWTTNEYPKCDHSLKAAKGKLFGLRVVAKQTSIELFPAYFIQRRVLELLSGQRSLTVTTELVPGNG